MLWIPHYNDSLSAQILSKIQTLVFLFSSEHQSISFSIGPPKNNDPQDFRTRKTRPTWSTSHRAPPSIKHRRQQRLNADHETNPTGNHLEYIKAQRSYQSSKSQIVPNLKHLMNQHRVTQVTDPDVTYYILSTGQHKQLTSWQHGILNTWVYLLSELGSAATFCVSQQHYLGKWRRAFLLVQYRAEHWI